VITLYTFGPYYGIPDGSPFVVKAMMLLKLAGLDYIETRSAPPMAPKGKLPFISDDGEVIADSTFIRFHIERKYGFDYDVGLAPEERAEAWAIEKMCEDHLYWAMLAARWLNEENYAKATAPFFAGLPVPLRLVLLHLVRRKFHKTLKLQGFGRHTRAEQLELAIADIHALSTLLGDKPFLMSAQPCGADAAVFGFVVQLFIPEFLTPLRAAAEKHENLCAYRDRTLARYFAG